MKPTPTLRFSIRRLFLLTLISFVVVTAALVIAASANKANQTGKSRAADAANSKSTLELGSKNSTDKKPLVPLAPVITATLTDNVAAATKVAPGGTINYTAVINNTAAPGVGNDATNVNFSAPLDPNTTLVAGSLHASPLAFDNAYTTVANTLLEVGVAASGNPAVTATGSLCQVQLSDRIARRPVAADC